MTDIKQFKVIQTARNKGLEPKELGNLVVGYNPEIHGEDSLEFTYKLPIGAIKRLIKSYYEDIQSIDDTGVYYSSSGSWEIRMWPYCYRMINEIRKQLDKHGIEGKQIDNEVWSLYFKRHYEDLKRYDKNHHGHGINDIFEPCNDKQCCNYSYSFIYKIKIFWILLKQLLQILGRNCLSKDEKPYISWHKLP